MTRFLTGGRHWIAPLIFVGFSGPSHAVWTNSYDANATVGYDSNFRLTEDDEIETGQTTVNLGARAVDATQTTNLALSATVGANEYTDSEIEGEETLDLDINWLKTYQRSNYNLGAAYLIEPTAETEVLDTGEIVDGSRDTILLTGGFRYQLTQRSTFGMDAALTDVSYDSELFDEFEETTLFFTYDYRADPNSGWIYTLGYTDFTPEFEEEAETTVATIGYRQSTSASTDITLNLGYTDVSGGDESGGGSVFSFLVSNTADARNTYSMSLTRDYRSGGSGELREQDTLELDWDHRTSDRVSFNTSIIALSSNLRDYGELGFGYFHQVGRRTTMGATYRYRLQESDTEEASSNSIFFNIAASFE